MCGLYGGGVAAYIRFTSTMNNGVLNIVITEFSKRNTRSHTTTVLTTHRYIFNGLL